MLALLALTVFVGATILAGARWLGRWAFALAVVPLLGVLGYVASHWSDIVSGRHGDHGGAVTDRFVWVEGLDLAIDVRIDGFSLLMIGLVAGMGVLIMAYGASYFGRGPAGARVAGLLLLFGASMLGLVSADNLIWLYACWELTSITSYLLIGSDQRTPEQRTAALQALVTTGAGGLAMLGGFVILAIEAGTWSLTEILAERPSGGPVGIALALVLAGAFTKSAQYPFHFWLPGAMVAPTPISAYLHSATMVKAGVYLVARFAPAFADVGIWRPTLVVVGLTTMLAGGLRALRQHDLKLLLAFGTVSQLGFMMVLAGVGHAYATKALTVLLLAHGLFKGALFLVVGIVDHEAGTRDLRDLPALVGHRNWLAVRAVAIVSAASMAGLPPVLGFVAKESAYEAFVHGQFADTLTLAGLVAGSVLTFAYSFRFARPFLFPDTAHANADRPADSVADDKHDHLHTPPPAFIAPAVALGLGTIIVGLGVGPILDDLIGAAANALDDHVGHPHLALWHGVNTALVLSACTIALGVALVVGRDRVEATQARLAPSRDGADGFAFALRLLNDTARRVTGFVQPGSLPVYIAIILLTVVGVPNLVLLASADWPGWPTFSDTPAQILLAAMVMVSAIGAAFVTRRFSAVLMLGGVGYSMALLFAVQGAADLALTQFAVETLSVVVFVLVIRHLPERFSVTPVRTSRPVRIAVASAVGLGMFGLAMMTAAGTADRAVSDEIVERAEPEGGGTNVVNVILVDVRGLDTLGEVTVIAVAALGVVAIARVGRRRDGEPDDGAPRADEVGSTGDRVPVEEAQR